MKSTRHTPIPESAAVQRASNPQRLSLANSLVMEALGHQPVVAVPIPYICLLGDCSAAIFLSQCCYLSGQQADSEGWFEGSHADWRTDLGLSPDQVRRCLRICSGLIEVRRMGLPARNFYRVDQDAIVERLSALPSPQVSGAIKTSTATAAVSTSSNHQALAQPVVGNTARPVVRQTQQHSSCQKEKEKNSLEKPKRDDIHPLPPLSTEMLTRLLDVWNANRGDLPEATGLSTHRKRSLTILLADCDGDIEKAAELLTDATKEAATDDFWKTKKFGLDTLLPKTLGKAESYRSRKVPEAPQVVPLPDFGVGQLVLYRRERYAIEAITDRYIDLWDDENGALRVFVNSDDIRSLRPAEVRA